jgi:hypothetical protein
VTAASLGETTGHAPWLGRMNPLAAAQRHGLQFSVHSDSWLTPIDPLLMVWTASVRKMVWTASVRKVVWTASVRKTPSGAVLWSDQCITVADDLRAGRSRHRDGKLLNPRYSANCWATMIRTPDLKPDEHSGRRAVCQPHARGTTI